MIFNPPKVNSTTESSERAQAGLDMNKLMPVFVAQLRELLGVPQVVSTVLCCSVLMWMGVRPKITGWCSHSPDAAVRSHY